METPNYYAVIPANVRYAKINANAKLLYWEITALCNKEGYCWATNDYFAKLYDVHKDTVSWRIWELIDNNFISSVIESRYKRKIYLTVGGSVKSPMGIGENTEGGIGENTLHNNTSNNIKTSEETTRVKTYLENEENKKRTSYWIIKTLSNLWYVPPGWETEKDFIDWLNNVLWERSKEFVDTIQKRMFEFETYWREEQKKSKKSPNWKSKLIYNFNNFNSWQ